jgi:hypothetical protein
METPKNQINPQSVVVSLAPGTPKICAKGKGKKARRKTHLASGLPLRMVRLSRVSEAAIKPDPLGVWLEMGPYYGGIDGIEVLDSSQHLSKNPSEVVQTSRVGKLCNRSLSAQCAQALGKTPVQGDVNHRVTQSYGVHAIDKEGAFSDDGGDAANRAYNDRSSATHPFEDGNAKAFYQRRLKVGSAALHQLQLCSWRHNSREFDTILCS